MGAQRGHARLGAAVRRQQEIPWRASSEIQNPGSFDRDALAAAIEADPRAERVEVRMVRHRLVQRRLLVELDYRARSAKDACIAADSLVEAALEEHAQGAMLLSTGIVGG